MDLPAEPGGGCKFAAGAPAPYDRAMVRRALLVLLLAGPASADNGAPQQRREGEYGGVTPGRPDPGARPAKPRRPPPKGTLTWIGFEAKDGGAQLFLQSVAPFEVTQRMEGATLVIHASLQRLGGNTWRPVDTRFFDNPLANIVAKRARTKRGIDVRVTFKDPKAARQGTVRTATEPDGYHYAYITFSE